MEEQIIFDSEKNRRNAILKRLLVTVQFLDSQSLTFKEDGSEQLKMVSMFDSVIS